ncbi:MAG: ankyrin repeat domain-containing protein [Candidatus Endonucleobacter bathymodioli]|uniref:Ankyrin repeat domain-containing protein n=1 Tax=Candidatus Endonucleibacter bathymodioli TaxID=539814 RepID=A0AA90SYF0_9GAMM|nr:ankyrin repeat domain-containing protein [Candidatus Endonucleobacter bathymodioli]
MMTIAPEQPVAGISNDTNITATPGTSTAGMSFDPNQPSTSRDMPSNLRKRSASSTPELAGQDPKKRRVPPQTQDLGNQSSLPNNEQEFNDKATDQDVAEEMDVDQNENDATPIPTYNIYETINPATAKDLPNYIQLPEVKKFEDLKNHCSFPKIQTNFLNDIDEFKQLVRYFVANKFDKPLNTFYKNIQHSYDGSFSHLLPLYQETALDLRCLIVKLKRYHTQHKEYDTDSKQKDYIATVLNSCLEGVDECAAGVHGRFRLSFLDLEASERGLAGKFLSARKTLLHEVINSFMAEVMRKDNREISQIMECHYANGLYNLACKDLNLDPIIDVFATLPSDKGTIERFKLAVKAHVSRNSIIRKISREWSNELNTLLQKWGISIGENKSIPASELKSGIIDSCDNRLFKLINSWLGTKKTEAINIQTLMAEDDNGDYSFAGYQEKLLAWVAHHIKETKDNSLIESKVTVFSSIPCTVTPNLHIGTIDGAFFWLFDDEQHLEAGHPCAFKSDNHVSLELSHLASNHLCSDPEANYDLLTQALEQTDKAEDIASFFMSWDISKKLGNRESWLTHTLANQLTDKLIRKSDEFKATLCKCVCDQVVNCEGKVILPEAIGWIINTPLLKPVLLELNRHKIHISSITQNLNSWQISDFSANDIQLLLEPQDIKRLTAQAIRLKQSKLASRFFSGYSARSIEDLVRTPSRKLLLGETEMTKLSKSLNSWQISDFQEKDIKLLLTPKDCQRLFKQAYALKDTDLKSRLLKAGYCDEVVHSLTLKHAELVSHLLATGHCDEIIDSLNGGEKGLMRFFDKNGIAKGVKYLLKKNDINQSFLYAAQDGNVESMKALLAIGASAKHSDPAGMTALCFAAQNGHLECVNLLLAANGTLVDIPDLFFRTPLTYAAENGHVECLKALLAIGANVNSSDYYGKTALRFAAKNGHSKCLNVLLDSGARVDLTDGNKVSPLSCAASAGHIKCMKILLDASEDKQVDTVDDMDYTPLIRAASHGHLECAEALLARGAKADAKTALNNTPLSYAAAGGHIKCLKMLLNTKGDQVDVTDRQGLTPLGHAAKKGHIECVEELLTANANTSIRDNLGIIPAHYLALSGHKKCMEKLLAKHPVDIATRDNNGLTLLHSAASKGHIDCCAVLLALDSTLADTKDKFGNTPLHLAAENGHIGCMSQLLTDADIAAKTKNNKGHTALDLAAKKGHKDCTNVLLSSISSDEEKTYMAYRALKLTEKYKHQHCISLLKRHSLDVGTLASAKISCEKVWTSCSIS